MARKRFSPEQIIKKNGSIIEFDKSLLYHQMNIGGRLGSENPSPS